MNSRGGIGGGAIRIVRPDGAVVNGTAVVNGVTVANGATITGFTTFNGGAAPAAGAAAAPGSDMLNPANPNQLLIYWLMDDPAVAAQYRAILRELSTSAFSPAELTKLMDVLETVSSGRPSPREFLLGRANSLQQLVASFVK